ncbi:MAG: hypothetical protein AAGK37_17885 [Pseudomonadota bacterium]
MSPDMLQEKKSETDAEKQKAVLRKLVTELSHEHPDLYYQPTTEIARLIRDHVANGGTLNGADRKLMEHLSSRDLQVLLSLH